MNICPNCQHQEIEGALFCSECGSQLIFGEYSVTRTIAQNPNEISTPSVNPTDIQMGKSPQTNGITSVAIFVVGFEKITPLVGKSEFILGRISEGQPVLPDIDLSPYEAYSQGVSRLHISIKISDQKVVVTDLGSANGTRVNGQKIMPHIDYPLNHGDIIALGKLKLQIHIK